MTDTTPHPDTPHGRRRSPLLPPPLAVYAAQAGGLVFYEHTTPDAWVWARTGTIAVDAMR